MPEAENAVKRFIIRYTDKFSQLCTKMMRYEKTDSLMADLPAGSMQPVGVAGRLPTRTVNFTSSRQMGLLLPSSSQAALQV